MQESEMHGNRSPGMEILVEKNSRPAVKMNHKPNRATFRLHRALWFCLGIVWLAAGITTISAQERTPMQNLDVKATEKTYKHFQFFGFVDGTLVGTVTLNGMPMHTLRGQSGNISNNAAQAAAKYGENVISVEITGGAGEIEYALLGASGDEDGFDADHIVDLTDAIPASGPYPWRKEYRFILDGAAFGVLKK